ncbi:MAG TPA: tetratricopeptide repeat protein [Vicinamibacterales bacterium]|nr:tetratricopeptide repeat protein [Vicinamibacterales bacterium]
MNAPRLVLSLLLVALVVPSTAFAQRAGFLAAFVQFYQTLRGAYGDEGPQLAAQLEKMTTALTAWDREIRDAEGQLQPRLNGADAQTALEVHTILASLYLERGRFEDALREFEADIKIDPTRAAFHRYKGLIYQATARPADAADAFRAAWLVDPTDPQNTYRLIVYRSASTTPPQIEQALASLAQIEGELTRLERPRATSLFRTTQAIDDDAGGAMGFVPPAYARGFSLLQRGEYEEGLAAFRAAVAADPLVADAASRSAPMAQGIAALRQGRVDTAVERLEAAVARAGDSSEAHRLLGTAYGIRGDMARSVQHLRDAVRLNPRDERSWIALASTLEDTGELAEAVTALRDAIAMLPDSGALRWRLASARRQGTDESDLDLLSLADRFVLFAGKGELFGQMAAMAQAHLEYDRAVNRLELRVALTPNNAAAHKALGRAYIDQSREEIGYAELVTALLLDPLDAETLTALGRLHLAAARTPRAIAALERALALDAGNSQALQALGNALTRAGRTAEGQQRLEESVRRQAQDVEDQRSRRTSAMLSVQAAIHVSRGEYEAAIDIWKQAITIRRDSVGPLQVADALTKAGRLEEASAVLQAAIRSNPRPEVHRRLAEVYAALGRTDESARERLTYTEQRLEELRRGG